jgi:putative cell wall-binding protein
MISAGDYHTVALKSDGSLWTWGLNSHGQLGDGTKDTCAGPERIGDDTDWVSVSAGGSQTLALKADGSLWAWGDNYWGQLGMSAWPTVPTRVGTDSDWVAVSAGRYHTVALRSDGSLWAWGRNQFGALGDGAVSDNSSVRRIGADSDWVAASAGSEDSFAIKSDGSLWAWGYNSNGQLGDGTVTPRLSPIRIGSGTDWVAVQAGSFCHTMAMKADGSFWAWGYNIDGQLGDGTVTDRRVPTLIALKSVAPAPTPPPKPVATLDTSLITRLNTSTHLKEMIQSDGNLVVYEDEPDGVQGGFNVAVFDLTTDTEATIAYDARYPHVSGDTIVYSQDDGIHAYDWPTRTDTLLPFSGTPVIDGSTVVYAGDGGIYGFDLSTEQTFTVSGDPDAFAPDVRNGWVVYTVERPWRGLPSYVENPMQGDIMAYRIATGTTYTLCSNPHDQQNPKISANGLVVWTDDRNSTSWQNEAAHRQSDVYGCSVYSRTNFAIATGPGEQNSPSVDGNIVTYCDSKKPGGYLVMGVDMLSGVHFGMVPPSLTGTQMLYWSGLRGGLLAWTKCTWQNDGSDDGIYSTDVYTARPTQIDVAAGSDPYTNAANASHDAFPEGAASAVIASGESWADDLAAASLSGTDTPLLLTKRTSLPKSTADEIRRLGVVSVTIIGGTDAVSTSVRSQILAIIGQKTAMRQGAALISLAAAPSVHRVSGDRYAVSGAIARRVAGRPGWDGTVIIASGRGFADALAAAPLSAARGIPIVLASAKELGRREVALLRGIGMKRALVIGNTKRVPSKVDSQLRAILGKGHVTRFSGKDSYSNAAALASYAVRAYGLSWNGVGIASSASFSNVLIGGLAKGRGGSVLLLSNGKSLSAAARSALKSHRGLIRKVTCVGSTKSVTKAVRGQVRLILH